jgi:hypothetical protein
LKDRGDLDRWWGPACLVASRLRAVLSGRNALCSWGSSAEFMSVTHLDDGQPLKPHKSSLTVTSAG